MILINRYNHFFAKELKNIISNDAPIQQFPLHVATEETTDLKNLASQFIRAIASEASRQIAANRSNGVPLKNAEPTTRAGGDLDSPIIEDWAGPVAGATYLEENLKIPRSTLHRWHRCNEVIALRKGRQRHVYPLAQFVDGRPASGIRDILEHIPHPRRAWFWMLHPSPDLNGRTPIDLLKLDLVDEAVSAAKEHASSFQDLPI